ncbi:type II toxin-antitoxin system RelE/ParE family toxin [Levilactobacillus parabrevis]|uniref:type II toxin-antitoxin system RelE/ParE family toxin n=1 Tax=Levilactobacillus parabrevis TaxID=357278 RepID=UPI0021A7B175|nr:type II toxin-antitoxin system RelE/ParE family toxin [Levilactobacillus parabrevis]MCT4487712.1 type II toxin-antitoxin system RelE/ParE family toxin [Levilactobacillus parabrevis]MCT4490700.1 type II toxin-antitoxin system RelE/ParE family toxin [Levilactobacillus parabrevis]
MEFQYYDWEKFDDFLAGIPKQDAAKLMSKIEEFGLPIASREKWIRKLEPNLYEIRSQFATNIQRAIYFHVEGQQFVITHGFTKKQQKTPLREIKKGRQRTQIFFKRKDENE